MLFAIPLAKIPSWHSFYNNKSKKKIILRSDKKHGGLSISQCRSIHDCRHKNKMDAFNDKWLCFTQLFEKFHVVKHKIDFILHWWHLQIFSIWKTIFFFGFQINLYNTEQFYQIFFFSMTNIDIESILLIIHNLL